MTRYVKYISQTQVEFAPKNKGSILNYDLNIPLLLQDGYKQFKTVERPTTNRQYHVEYTETETKVKEVIVYDETQEEADEREYTQRETQFDKDFFITSLGYVRRSATMADGSQKDFLSDLLSEIALAVNGGATVPIITYNRPDFSEEVEDWTQYQNHVAVTAQFIQECLLQQQNDFIPVNLGE